MKDFIRGVAKQIVHALDGWFSKVHPALAAIYFDTILVVWGSKCRLRRSDGVFLILHQGGSWRVSHPLRSSWYRRGFRTRGEDLVRSYSLEEVFEKLNFPVVVDCGANTGDLASTLPPGSKYYGFEPDPDAFDCLEFNVAHLGIETMVKRVALSDFAGEGKLFISTEGADSSLIQPSRFGSVQTVQVVRLDSIVEELGIRRIDVLKVEAEGLEPEVLEGARTTLEITNFVAVDAGPERDGADTLPQVDAILTSSGFRLARSISKVGRFLYVR